MHSATLLATLFAASAIAGPQYNKHAALHRRHPAEVVDVVTVVDWTEDIVTVTAGDAPASTPVKAEEYVAPTTTHHHHHKKPHTTSSSTYVSPSPATYPASSSSAAPVQAQEAPKAAPAKAAAPAPASGSGSSYGGSAPDNSGSYQDVILSNHKSLRANFGHGELIWNDTLASLAEYEAKAANCQMAHNLNDQNGQSVAMGQNLAMGTDRGSANGNFEQIGGQVQAWYGPGEFKGYSQASNKFTSPPSASDMEAGQVDGSEILHFSQLVWKGTEQVGCYTVTNCPDTGYGPQSLTFCNYYPAGNIADENDSNQYQSYLENVGQPVPGAKQVWD